MLCLLQIEGLWEPVLEQVFQRHFPSHIYSFQVSVSDFGDCHNMSGFYIIIICYGDVQSGLGLTESSDDGLHFLAINSFLIKVYTLLF